MAFDISARFTPRLNFIDRTRGCWRNHLQTCTQSISIDVKNVFTFFILATFFTFPNTFYFAQRFLFLKKRALKVPSKAS